MTMKYLLKNAMVLRRTAIERADILIEDGRIVEIGPYTAPGDVAYDLSGRLLMPGLVQGHVHLCQTLFRGMADDLPLLDWLKKRIWPLEASHDGNSTYWSAMLGCMEMLRSGVTSVCVMESVRHTDRTAEAIEKSGIRAVFGKAMMDYSDTPEELGGLPTAFMETTQESLSESLALMRRWHNSCNGRIRYAFAPRGVLTTSEDLLHSITRISKEEGVLLHTHACETRPETELVRQRRGDTEIRYLARLGALEGRWILAHGVTVDDEDIEILRSKHVAIAHCPSTNLKLGSGIAPVARLREAGITVALASDGAPANNNLDPFVEMRLAALLAKGVTHDPTVLSAGEVLDMATRTGAEAIGFGDLTGSLEVGKRGDVIALDMEDISTCPAPLSAAQIVYAGCRSMVSDVMVDGQWILRDKRFIFLDEEATQRKARKALSGVMDRFERRVNL